MTKHITIELTEDQANQVTWLLEDHLARVRHPEAEAFTKRILAKLAKSV